MAAVQHQLFEPAPSLVVPAHLVAAGVSVAPHPRNPYCVCTPDGRWYDAPTADGVLALAQTWHDVVWMHREAAR